MIELTTRAARRPLRQETALWQKAAIGMLVLALIGNMVLGGLYLSQKRYLADLEDAYASSESTREAAVVACGRLAQKCQELEAEIALSPETQRMHEEIARIASPLTDSDVERIVRENIPASRYAPIDATEYELLARLVWLEARGEPAEGQQAVAEVVLNRVAADNFPGSVEEVIFQKRQFAPAARIPDAEPTEAQYQAVDAALYGEPVLPLDVVYFSVAGENDNVWGTIGGHVFCYQYGWEADR